MTFNDALTRNRDNLDAAHDALLDSGDRETLETEALENEILADEETFSRLASLYARESIVSPEPLISFLIFGVNRLRRERSPQWEGGWKNE